MKQARRGKRQAHPLRPLDGHTLGLMLEKPSTRTRVSFEVAMRQLGGEVVVLSPRDMQLGRGETIPDTGRVLSRFLDALVLRTDSPAKLRELAAAATIPVINGLTSASHPVQLLADILTFEEHRGPIGGRTVAWCGAGNNVAASWIEAAIRFGFTLRLATPPELRPNPAVLDWAARNGAGGGRIELVADPRAAVQGAACVVTDTWTSMSDDPAESRHARLEALPGGRGADGRSGARRAVHALPARASRRGGHRRGDRGALVGGVRRGREPAARAEGTAGLGAGRRELEAAGRVGRRDRQRHRPQEPLMAAIGPEPETPSTTEDVPSTPGWVEGSLDEILSVLRQQPALTALRNAYLDCLAGARGPGRPRCSA